VLIIAATDMVKTKAGFGVILAYTTGEPIKFEIIA
jgi:hypothetical protein